MSISSTIKKSRDLFDEGVRAQKNNGNPYWPNWEAVKSRYLSSQLSLLESVMKEIEKMKIAPKCEHGRIYTGCCGIEGKSKIFNQSLSSLQDLIRKEIK